ncbi:MAG: RNA-guided pseudouridylation complex pseudouridine synthase subunit Cbf5 [Candidatus Woesearchaeota archaeon]
MLPFEKIQRSFLERCDAPLRPYVPLPIADLIERCVVVVDKPRGPTSHQVAEWVKDMLHVSRAGQAGTLDPAVTGLLPVATTKATKLLQVLLEAGKEYVCSMHVHGDVSDKQLYMVLEQFVGKIKQFPPVKSAVKRQWRYRRVYYLEVLERDGREILFKVGCQAGTYIRKLCHDIGMALGCGAHMAQLVRSKSGGYTWDERVTLQQLKDAYVYYEQGDEAPLRALLHPQESLVRHLPRVYVDDASVVRVRNGIQVKGEMLVKIHTDIQKEETVALFSLDQQLLGFGTALYASKQMLTQQGMVIKLQRISA